MYDLTWSAKEKQLARAVFEHAAAAEEKELLDKFKEKAARLESLEELWALQFEIRESEREFHEKYDYRYSRLILVFARLIREGRVSLEALDGLRQEKLKLLGDMRLV